MKLGDVSLGLSSHFIGSFGRAGGTAKMLQKAADIPSLMKQVVALFSAMEQQSVCFNYNMPLADMVAAGKYCLGSESSSWQRFRFCGTGDVVMPHLHHIGFPELTYYKALADIGRLGLRPATLPELLLFGANYPEEQKKYRIVALDKWSSSSFDEDPCIPMLYYDGMGRHLSLMRSSQNFDAYARFAVVRE